jgi:cytochrome P450
MSSSPVPAEAPGTEPAFDPLAPGFFDDPYPQYEALRTHHPIYFEPRVDAYFVTRYDDVHRLTRDRGMLADLTRANPTPRIMARITRNATLEAGSDKWMLFRDGDDHARLRRAFSQAFTPKAIASWRQRTTVLVDQLLSTAEDDKPFDVISQFARPLPAQIISEMIGVPDVDIPQLLEWSDALVRYLESFNTAQQEEAAVDAIRDMTTYFRRLLADKRSHPGDDLISALLAPQDPKDRLSDAEIVVQLIFLHNAGHGTTENLIGNGLVHLLANPEQLARLRADPGLDANAIEELLRFDAPIQFARRIATNPIELRGVFIPAGGDVMLALGAANRDPEKWGERADSLDLLRPDATEHAAFSGGAHHCLGALLARLEAQIALPGIVRRFPRLAPAYDDPEWATRVILRGVERLPVHLNGG